MAKHVPVALSGLLLLLPLSPLFSGGNTLRIALWSLLDPIPESPESAAQYDDLWGHAREKLKETAPTIIEGMVWGWEFSYTPSDLARNVAEYFSFESPYPFEDADKLRYTEPSLKDNRLYCWVDFDLTESMILLKNQWQSVAYRKIHGKGTSPVQGGSIREACGEALKHGMREYARTLVKNKPREIAGRVIVVNDPWIKITAGRYEIDLDFFADLRTIIPYTRY